MTETRQEKPVDFGTDKKPEGGRPSGKPSGGYRDTDTSIVCSWETSVISVVF